MPSILTHDFFGRDVYGSVARELGFSTTDEMATSIGMFINF